MSNFVRKIISVTMMLSFLFALVGQQGFASDSIENGTITAQDGGNGSRSKNEKNGKTNFINFGHERRVQVANENAAFLRFSDNYAEEFGLRNPGQELKFLEKRTAPSGSSIYIYQQVHNGVPILGGEILIAVDRQSRLSAISGEVSPDLQLGIVPQFAEDKAASLAKTSIQNHEGISDANWQITNNGLAIYDPALLSSFDRGPASLVWTFKVRAEGYPIDYIVLIDANRGVLRLAFNQIHEIVPENHIVQTGSASTVPVSGSGLALEPNFNGTAETYNSNSSADRDGVGSSTLVCADTQPIVPALAISGADACDTVSASPTIERNNAAHFFAFDVFNYFDFYHNRNSLDGAGMTIISNVDYQPGATPYNNAFWDGSVMTYGNGDFFTADDIVGHEMTHGVTENISPLFYYYETGAINEAYSDIFGEFIDQLNGINSLGGPDLPAERWYMGEDLGIGAIRYMADPTVFGDPDRMTSGNYYAPQGENNTLLDSGGVHINSGVANKAAYLMVDGDTFNGYTVSPLGATTTDSIILAGAIWYEAYTYLTSGSDYGVLYQALNTACNALIGQPINGTAETLSAADCTEVDEAALAVEMNQPPVGNATYAPQPDLACPSGETPVIIFADDIEGGTGNFTGTTVVDTVGVTSPPIVLSGIAAYGEPYAWSGTGSIFLTDSYLDLDHYIEMVSDVPLIGGVEYYLYFQHSWGLEDYTSPIFPANGVNDNNMYDAAVLEYTIDGGSSWLDAGSLFYSGRDYNGTIATGYGNPLEGRDAWGYDSHGYVVSWFDLTSLAGQDVNFRWRMTGDADGPDKYFGLGAWDYGYWLDDVTIFSCGAPPTPGPAVFDPGVAKSGTYGPGEVGLPGESITWTITVSNPTDQVLTNIVVSDTLVSELQIDNVTISFGSIGVSGQTVTATIPSLSPGDAVTITIETTVLGSPASGTFTNTANVTSDSGSGSATASLAGVSGLPATGYMPKLRW